MDDKAQIERQKRLIDKILKASKIISEAHEVGSTTYSFVVTEPLLLHIMRVHTCDEKQAYQIIKDTLQGDNIILHKNLTHILDSGEKL